MEAEGIEDVWIISHGPYGSISSLQTLRYALKDLGEPSKPEHGDANSSSKRD